MQGTPSDKFTISTAQAGAAVQNLYFHRTMKLFLITEDEIQSVGSLDLGSSICLAAGFSLISLAAGIAVTHAYTEKITPFAEVLFSIGAPALVISGVVAFGVCAMFIKKRGTVWKKIIATSRQSPTSNTAAAQQGAGPAGIS